MKFGLCYIPDYHAELSGTYSDFYDGMLDEIVLAEQLGFHGAWFAEHRVPNFAFGSPAMFIAAAARRTSRIRLGSSIALLPLNDPIRLAEDYAMADVLTHGRVDFGAGRGLYKYDYEMSRVDLAESKERFLETMDIVRKAWGEEQWSHEGKYFTYNDHRVAPRTIQKDGPPIWVAAVRTPESYQWAGENGFNLLVAPFLFPDASEQSALIDIYRSALSDSGFDPESRDMMAAYHMYCSHDPDDVDATADPALIRYQEFTQWADQLRDTDRDPVAYAAYQNFGNERATRNPKDMREKRAVIGSPDECAEKIRDIKDRYGITYLSFEVNFGALPHDKVMGSLQLFADEVMPRFAPVAAAV